MSNETPLEKLQSELRRGMELLKCRKCGCMKEALESLSSSLPSLSAEDITDLLRDIKGWLDEFKSVEYSCLGCRYCFAAVAMNIFAEAFPEATKGRPRCAFEVREQWPPVPGEYFVFCEGPECPIAVSTLASIDLAEKLARRRPRELCIVGKTETENIGIEKVIKNVITNPTIHYLLLVGKDSEGHHSGGTLLALWKNGVDENMRVIGAPGRRPILRNVSREEVDIFRKNVQVVDMIGCEEVNMIVKKMKELTKNTYSTCHAQRFLKTVKASFPEVVYAEEPDKIEMDKAGYFIIIPQREKNLIIVEHYSYDNKLLRIIRGKNARSIYWTIIRNKWVTQLSHAAYLGKELMKAELSIKLGFKYIQDKI